MITYITVSRSEQVFVKQACYLGWRDWIEEVKKLMYAVIETGGKQYRVQEGDVITIEKLDVNSGEKVEFDKVLVLNNDSEVQVGAPYLGEKVFGTVVENGKAKKVIIYKYKSKKDFRKKQGHRQPYTMIEITGIGTDKPAKKAALTEVEAVSEEAEGKKPSFKSMKKVELIAFAKENNIQINEKATNADLIATIEEALK